MHDYRLGVFASVAAIAIASPAYAANLEVTNVAVQAHPSGLQLLLATPSDGTMRPQVFTVSRQNNTITDILNTELKLGDRDRFTQQNPAPGIKAVQVLQLDNNSVRVIVIGEDKAPVGKILNRTPQGIVLGFSTEPAPANSTVENQVVTQKAPTSMKSQSAIVAQNETPQQKPTSNSTSSSSKPRPEPEVIFPKPQITSEGKPDASKTDNVLQPVAPLPPFLPRASAPPTGDIAVSTTDSSFTQFVDLGTAAVVPRLVLRDAPTQDVISLLARSADLNLVLADDIAGKTISLDLENEPVQDVFNYVLMLSDLKATLRGRTVFVGSKLPDAITPKITRTFRLNQAKVAEAKTFLEAAKAARSNADAKTGIVPEVAIVTDERLNSITITGEAKAVEIASNFLTQLDARRRQVAVNVKIIDVTLDGNHSVASDIKLLLEDRVGISSTSGITTSPTSLKDSSTEFSIFGNQQTLEKGTGTVAYGDVFDAGDSPDPENTTFVGPIAQAYTIANIPIPPGLDTNQIGAVIKTVNDVTGTTELTVTSIGTLLESKYAKTNFAGQLTASLLTNNTSKVVADPTLIVQEGEKANINLTDDIITGTTTTVTPISDNQNSVVTTPKIDSVGLQLEVNVSRIDDNGFITLEITPNISGVAGTVTTTTIDPSTKLAVTNTTALKRQNQLTSGKIRLRDDQTFVLAGVIRESQSQSTSKVPILGDLPLIGSLFRSSSTTNSRRELVFIVTPQIVDDSQQAGWGYSYTPGPETQKLLKEQNFPVPEKP